jgi:UDP-N-acetylmuramyl tripeptide synthase
MNDDKTRSFVSLLIDEKAASSNSSKNKDTVAIINQLVTAVDNIVRQYNQPVYYDNPSHHMSVAWCIGDITKTSITPLQRQQPQSQSSTTATTATTTTMAISTSAETITPASSPFDLTTIYPTSSSTSSASCRANISSIEINIGRLVHTITLPPPNLFH